MNTNHKCKNNQLSDTLRIYFEKNVNLAHIKLISLFIMALCKAKTVCFSLLSTYFDSPAKADSCLRRIQRYFSKHSISQDLVAKFIFQILPRKEKYRLAIDRTNWQFGKTDINIFMLAVVHDGVAYPLLFSMLPKRGTSNTQERIDLLQRYINLFGTESIDCLLADREFVGERWIEWLNNMNIRYHIRIRENFWAFNPRSGKQVRVSWLFNSLKVGEASFFYHIFYVKGQACYLSGSKIKGHDGKHELQVIISFNKPENAVSSYRQRWQVETLFRSLKSSGFNIEDTHLTDIERVEKLLLIVMMAFVWCYNIGEFVNQNLQPIRILKNGRKAKSIFRYGLDLLTEFLVRGRNDFHLPFFDFLLADRQT